MLQMVNMIWYIERLQLEFPANTAATAGAFGLWVGRDAESGADELCCVVEDGAFDEGHGDGVDEDVGGLDGGVGETAAKKG